MTHWAEGGATATAAAAATVAAGLGEGEVTRRSKEELAKAAELFAGHELLDYSEEEVSGDERREDQTSPEGEEEMDAPGREGQGR